RLSLGQTLGVTITIDEHAGVLQVPAQAVIDLGEGPILTVVREGKAAVLHPETETPHDGWVAVAGTDLKESEPVIVEGGYNLPEGTPVKVEEAKGEHEEAKGEHEEAKGEKEDTKGEHEPAKETPKGSAEKSEKT